MNRLTFDTWGFIDMPMARFFSGGGGSPKIKTPEKPAKQEETRRIEESAGEERKAERRRVPPGRKATLKYGIQRELEKRLGM